MTATHAAFEGPGPDAVFESHLRNGKLMLQRCKATGKFFFFPATLSPHSGTPEWDWAEVSGHGTVHTTTTVRRKPDRGGDYNVCIVELDEGPRMMTRVENIAPDDVVIGLRVAARIIEEDENALVVFDPLPEGGA
jgi:uncharacterized OB-fold protein